MGFFFNKKKVWREDEEPFLKELKTPKPAGFEGAEAQKQQTAKKPELHRKPELARKPVTFSDKQLSVKERLDKMHAQQKSQVLQRLEGLRENPRPVPRPLEVVEKREEPKKELLDHDSMLTAKLDRAIKRIDMLRGKMLKADSYLSLFYELKVAEKEFVEAYNEVKAKDVDLTPMLEQKAEQVKGNLRSNKSPA